MEWHQAMIPGSMTRLMRQWREDLRAAIEARSGTTAEVETEPGDDVG